MQVPGDSDFIRFEAEEIEQSIPARFSKQVARYQDRIAVRTMTSKLTYAELDRQSNKIANLLLAAGAERLPVVLLIDDAPLLICCIFGVLKAGACYVAVDPRHQDSHLVEVLEDVGARNLLADSAGLAKIRGVETGFVKVFDIENDSVLPEHDPPGLVVSADMPAYVYYTSGTTGRPKGVFDNHRNVLHNVMRYTNSLTVSCNDRLTLLQSSGFSGAVSNVFTALLNGATLLPCDVRSVGSRRLASWLNEVGATIYHSVPTLFRRVVGSGERLKSMRVVRLEGDSASRGDVELFQQHFGDSCILVNGLGATETGISRQFFVDHQSRLDGNRVPVGYPTADMNVVIVDTDGNRLADGQTGEIVVESRYLACGYWNDPERTAAAFRPGSIDPAARRYHTGDLGRLNDDCLEHLGRVDARVKNAGIWIDTDEIAAVLTSCDGVHGAMVLAQTDPIDLKSAPITLVAFVVGVATQIKNLQEAVGLRCGPAAVPRDVIVLDSWPTDGNGKVDQAALLALAAAAPDTEFTAPRGSTEVRVAAIFSEILGCQTVSSTADFYDLGGDSLAAVDAVIKLSDAFARPIPVAALHHGATVRKVALAVENGRTFDVLVPLKGSGTATPFFCVHAHMGHVFNLRELAGQFSSKQPFFGLQADGILGQAHPPSQLSELADLYILAIRQIQSRGPYAIGGYCFGGLVALEMAQRLQSQGETVRLLTLIDTDLPVTFSARRVRRLLRGILTSTRSVEATPAVFAATQEALRAMLRAYRPAPYPGRALIVLSSGQREDRGWSRLFGGELRIERMSATPAQLLRTPNAGTIAQLLESELTK